ncbi:MAG: hypothetical protein FJX30_03345 [Alphaproteobacteria bacterium]|nr:hypothetical protein [Alphaproteobacteria bacterium]
MSNFLKSISYYCFAPLISLLVAIIYYQYDVHKIDPLNYDYLGAIFYLKTVINNGDFCNNFVANPSLDVNCFNDHVMIHNLLITLLFRFLGWFTRDVFMIYGIYFYFSVIVIAISTNYVLLKFQISKFNSTIFSILFSLANARMNSFGWMSVGHFFTVPFIVLLCYRIYENQFVFCSYKDKKLFINSSSIKQNFLIIFISYLSFFSSAYYGYLLIILLFLTTFLHLFRWQKFDINFFSNILLIIFSIFFAFFTIVPVLLFWAKNGHNDIITRSSFESIVHGLSISSMLIPVQNHFLEIFVKLNNFFVLSYNLMGEKKYSSIGLFSSIGFCLLIAQVMSKALSNPGYKNKFLSLNFTDEKYRILVFISGLNLIAILFFQSESFHAFLNLFFTNIRSLARFNILFIFLSYLLFGLLFDEIIKQKKFFNKNVVTKFLIIIISILAFLDQAGDRKKIINPQSEQKYQIYQDFVKKVESSLPRGSLIFVTPVNGFPESPYDNYLSSIGYIFSDNLRFSYPVPKNRKSHQWQENVVKLEFNNFIDEIINQGFVGVWVQRDIFMNTLKIKLPKNEKLKGNELEEFEQKLTKISKNKIESLDTNFVFYEIDFDIKNPR